MKRFLEKHLKVYVHEAATFLWITSIFFVIFFVTAIFRNYVDAAFLKRYGPDSIPWMLVINAILTFVFFGLSDRLARRFMDHTLLGGFLAIYAGSVTILFFTVKAGVTLSYPILYQLLYLLDSVLLVYLWNMAGDLFNTRQGKRIFPLITAGQVMGATLGSFATRPVNLLIGENATLLLFGAVCLATALFLFRTGSARLGLQRPQTSPVKVARGRKRLREVPGLMMRYPIIRYLVIVGLIPNILLPIFFYQFSVIANATFTSEQSLISFLSLFRGTTTMVTFVLLFFVGRLYSSIGLANASLVQPLNFGALFLGLTAFFNIYVAAYGQFSAILIQRAIAGPVTKIFFNIVPGDLMVWSRTFVRGTVTKVGMLAGSLLMIVLKPFVGAHTLAPIACVLAVYWTVESLMFRKQYKRILKQAIVEKEIDFDQIESVRNFDGSGAAIDMGLIPVEDRTEDRYVQEDRLAPTLDPDVALKLLDDPNPKTRADAAASFAVTKDIRAVRKLILLLAETDDQVSNAALESLVVYRDRILPYLEISLIESNYRLMQGILEVIRLSGVKDFEMIPFIGKQLTLAYGNLIAVRALEAMNPSRSVEMLKECLLQVNSEVLRLIFYALWVSHSDMRLMYQALQSETASIAVEMVETSIAKEISPYLIPLIDDIPRDEKIEKGRKLLPLIRNDNPERILMLLAGSDDALTRLLALFVIGDQKPDPTFIPVIESRMHDSDTHVQTLAKYALAKTRGEAAQVPDIMEIVDKLKAFSIFEGMGVRELHALAQVLTVETFKPDDIMIQEQEENSSLYLVVTGQVAIYEGYGTPQQRHKATISGGSFLGELSMFTRLPPNATCVAAEVTQAYVLAHHYFVEIMKVYPQIGINLCRFFSMMARQGAY